MTELLETPRSLLEEGTGYSKWLIDAIVKGGISLSDARRVVELQQSITALEAEKRKLNKVINSIVLVTRDDP